MGRCTVSRSPRLRRSARWFLCLGPALLALTAGCTSIGSWSHSPVGQVARGSGQQLKELPNLPKQTAKPEAAPTAPSAQPPGPARLGTPVDLHDKLLPINLDTVLRLADTQNGQTAIAREKLREAFANQDLAAKAWLPDVWLGAGWYRHEGGIANEDGTITRSSFGSMFAGLELRGRFDLREAVYLKVDAARRVWQQRAEVSKLSSEALLDASSTYIDLLAARAAEAVAVQMEEKLQDLLTQTEGLAKSLPTFDTDKARAESELQANRQLRRRFQENARAAEAKLVYLLGLDPASHLAVMDRQLAAFVLANADAPVEELVAQAMRCGPAIQEMEGLLQLVHQADEKSQGLSQYLPVFDLRLAEGGFGTGPGDSMVWDNRMDLGIQMRWNLSELWTKCEKRRLAQARIGQAHATYDDLRAKLTMGVQESREAILSERDQIAFAQQQVSAANNAYKRSRDRLGPPTPLKERSPGEVLLSVRSLSAAELAYLGTIRDHDKAQLRLAILTGTVGGHCDH